MKMVAANVMDESRRDGCDGHDRCDGRDGCDGCVPSIFEDACMKTTEDNSGFDG